MAIHPGKQERPFGFAHCAVILLAVQSGTKTQILNHMMLLRRYRGICNLEASLHSASTDFHLFGFPRENTHVAEARYTNWRSYHRNALNSSLFHDIGVPQTRPRCWIFWRWPDATYRLPLFSWILDCPSPVRQSTAWFTQAQTSATACERDAVSTCLHGSKTALLWWCHNLL